MFYWRTNNYLIYRTILILLCLSGSLSSCNSKKQPAGFYPIDSLITGQIQHLTEIRAGLFKEAYLSGKVDTLSYTPSDTAAWISELDIFRKLQIINKAVNKTNYVVEEAPDPVSNLFVKSFTSLKALPVVYLKVYHHGNIYRPRKIEALYDEANPLYGSARQLSLNFEQINNTTVLTSYAIEGGQKMMFSDSIAFYIKGKILVD